jgi:hypothetical protein
LRKQAVPVHTEEQQDVGEKEGGGNDDKKRQQDFVEAGVERIFGQVVDDEEIQKDKNEKNYSVESEKDVKHKKNFQFSIHNFQ